ncbi:MAG: DUF4252 domain-containing protein [Flavobacterium psychrophilum]|nr:MAG: DUF4252 domain-containing protein [Flavobacterium psychrophilum]
MKKLIATLVLAAMPFVTFAQTNAFSKFDNVEEIANITLNKELFEMVGSVDSSAVGDAGAYLKTAKGLDRLKILTTSDKKYKKQLRDAVTDYLKVNSLQELLSVNAEGAKVKVYVKQGSTESIITEGLVFVENDNKKDETVLISFTGKIDLNDIKDFKGLKGCKGDKGSKGAKGAK